MDLKFAAIAKPKPLTPESQRRQKLVRRIDKQITLVREMIEGKQPQHSWVWTDEAGTHFVPIRYGRHPIELKKGMFSIQCKDLDEIEHAFCIVRAKVMNGEFDDQLTQLSLDIRTRFQSRRP
jgi:hypothetical protein